MTTENLTNIDERINLVIADMLKRFPDCSYTVEVLLWDDGTSSVECRYGVAEKIYTVKHYKGKLTYLETILRSDSMKIDAEGNKYYVMLGPNWDNFFEEVNSDKFVDCSDEAKIGYIICRESLKEKSKKYYPPLEYDENKINE